MSNNNDAEQVGKSSLDYYLDLVENTESPLLYHRWSFISAIGACLGRSTWLDFGEERIYPNQFVVLIGPAGARKSGAIKIAKSLLNASGYEFFVGDSSSKEKFLADWEHGFDKINRGIETGSKMASSDRELEVLFGGETILDDRVSEAYIVAGELQDFIGSGNGGFISTLTNLWDNLPKYSDRFKNSKSLYIPNPTISILGGATVTTFADIFSANIIGQGMLSRMILVYGNGQRQKLTIPPPLPAELKQTIQELLLEIRTNIRGCLVLPKDSEDILDYIYKNYVDINDSRLSSYCSRRFTHLLKLCVVIAASELSTTITPEMVIYANTILTYTELYMPKALGEFGKSRSSEVSQVVLDAIANAGDRGVTVSELMEIVSQDIDSIHELGSLVLKLSGAKKVRTASRPDGEVAFVVISRKLSDKVQYVDFTLLPEFRNGENE